MKHLLELHGSGNYTEAEPAELFSLGRSTIDRTIDRMGPKPVEPERPSAHVLPRFQTTESSTPPFAAKGGSGRKRAANRTVSRPPYTYQISHFDT